MKRSMIGSVAALFVLMSGVSGFAQRPASSFDVIVVFKQNASFEQFRGSYRADERSQADPDAWDYLDRGVVGATMSLENKHKFKADKVFSHAIRGFSARLTTAQMFELDNDPTVDFIENDGEMYAIAQTLPWGIDRIDADLSSAQAGNGSGSVTGVNVYVIDSGIDTGHADLNVVRHVNFAGGQNKDCNGHGTHVAGTVAARDNGIDVVGVVPGAPVTGVKVLGCNGSGSYSNVIKGIDWVRANAVKPAVANMSLGGGVSTAVDNAVKAAADSGVIFAIAAGNDGVDACTKSPARAGTHSGVITVAATASNDTEASWSNYGSCVDIWAPGVNIVSTAMRGGTTTMSGTSMASPHVAGVAALYLSGVPSATAALAESSLKTNSVATGTASKDGRAIKLVYAKLF